MQNLYQKVAGFIKQFSNEQSPIKGRDIAAYFGLSDADIRHTVNQIRQQGVPICSTNNGYYYSTDPKRIIKTIQSMQGRVDAQLAAIEGLKQYLDTERREV